MMVADRKNPAAVELGTKGGKARMSNLTDQQRTTLATAAANTRWKNDRRDKAHRVPVHRIIRIMMLRISDSGLAHTLFIERDVARFCEAGSQTEREWMQKPETCVGTYAASAIFTDILTDTLSL